MQSLTPVPFTSPLPPTSHFENLCSKPISCLPRRCLSRERDYDDIDEEDPFNPRARRMVSQNPNLTNMHSFCSYSSSMGSQSSLHPPAPAVSNAPMSEYMWVTGNDVRSGSGVCSLKLCVFWIPHLSRVLSSFHRNQTALFGGNPRYENVPLIGRGSPPPSVRWVPGAKSFLWCHFPLS